MIASILKECGQLPAAAGDLTQQFLAAWLANNPNPFSNPLMAGLGAQLLGNVENVANVPSLTSCPLEDDEESGAIIDESGGGMKQEPVRILG
jgi:hypothetical protein